jgi:hypothetical protein
MKKQSVVLSVLFVFLMIGLSSCAPEGHSSKEYGFFGGLIHGMVIIFALIGKLFGADVGIYAANNTGFFYWLGFILGLGFLGGGGGAASRR